MPTTPLGLPYPAGTDLVMSGNDDIQALAEAVDANAVGDTAAWTDVASFFNGWANFGGAFQVARYRKINGVVYVQGLIAGGTLPSDAFQLPAGFRPSATLMFDSNSNGAAGRLEITAAGVVTPTSGSNIWFSICLSFPADA